MPDEPRPNDSQTDPASQPSNPNNDLDDNLLRAVAELDKEPQPFHVLASDANSALSQPLALPKIDSAPHKSKKKLIIIIAIVVVLLVGAGGGTTFALWFNNPDKVMSDAVTNLVTAHTYISSGDLTYKDDQNNGVVDLTFNSKSDVPNLKGEFDASLDVNYKNYKFSLAGSGLLSQTGNVYFKFDGIKKAIQQYINSADVKNYTNNFPGLSADVVALSDKIDGKWVEVDQASLKNVWSTFDYSKDKACFANAYTQLNKQPSEKSQITQAYADNPFITIQNKGSQTVNGVDSMQYNVTANVAKYNRATDAFAATNFGKNVQACVDTMTNDKETAQEKQDDKKSRDQTAADDQKQINKAKLTVWVSRWSHEFTKTSFAYNDTEAKTETTATVNYTLNQTVNAPSPANSISLKVFQSDINKIEQDIDSAVEEQNGATQNQVNSYEVINSAEVYAANNNGTYPTLTQLEAAQGDGALNSDLAAVISSTAPDAAHQSRIQYTVCDANKGYNVYYWDASTNSAVLSDAAIGCNQTT